MIFEDREDAGRKLASQLLDYSSQNPLILALARGGVPVGYQVAQQLNAPLDVLVIRKLSVPWQPEYGIGAIGPLGVKVLDQIAIDALGISDQQLEQIEHQERQELARRIKEYRGSDSMPDLSDRTVIIVDDGLATGVTAGAAIAVVKKLSAKNIIFAVPVCAEDAADAIAKQIDKLVCLIKTPHFRAVAVWYAHFDQVTDEEVVKLLK